jgi:hypothetical protein
MILSVTQGGYMEYDKWFKYFDGDEEAINIVHSLQKETPYTDEYIIEAIEKIGEVYFKLGVTKREVAFAIFGSELMALK